MKKPIAIVALACLPGLLLWACKTKPTHNTTAYGSITVPTDAIDSCSLTPAAFASWFAGGKTVLNGMVTPANSVQFPHNNNCDFYQWSERMFLWLTSPDNGKTVMESSTFFTVSPADSAGNRTFLPHTAGTTIRMDSHLAKVGAARLPIIRDKKGNIFQVETAKHGAKEFVKDGKNNVVEVSKVASDAKAALVFTDVAGKTIDHPKAIIQHRSAQHKVVHRFKAGNKFVFLDDAGNVVDSEEGQATGDVLMSQGGSLVYYVSMVNDVYAWYATMAKNTGLMIDRFPTKGIERDLIVAYAKAHGQPNIPDANALAMEMKTSWVEASTLPDSTGAGYVTMMATLPTYNTSNADYWTPNGEKTVKMAMVGVHVVGSVAGHPEMIWSTFEHQSNTPNGPYDYLDKTGKKKHVGQDNTGTWLFSSAPKDTAINISHMTISNPKDSIFKGTDTIFAQIGKKIAPSNTLRTLPWGSAADSLTNAQDGSSAASNSEIISINNSVRSLLAAGDVRANYLLMGATWTENGAAPNGQSYGYNKKPGVAIGTSVLANSTMETYFQSPKNSCYTCHSAFVDFSVRPDTISHVFAALQPLINKAGLKDKQPVKKK